MPDPERIVALAHDGDWGAAWSLVHDAAEVIETDTRISWAASTLTDATFRRLANGSVTPDLAESLERLILLHSGGLYHVSGERFQTAVVRLVRFHRDRNNLEDARHYARFCPTAEPCADVLADREGRPPGLQQPDDIRSGPEVASREIDHDLAHRFSVSVTDPAESANHRRDPFRSGAERAFYRAVREVYPTYLPVPNVSLKTLVDADAIKPQVSGAARSLLYTGLVDCVLFNPESGLRPVACFELDSSHHDAPDRRENDRHKNRILALAGYRLVRIRPRGESDRDAFVRLLRSLSIDLDVGEPRGTGP